MPNPKRRHSQQRSAKRRTHYKAETIKYGFHSKFLNVSPQKGYDGCTHFQNIQIIISTKNNLMG